MILIVNLNPALDRIYSIEGFELNSISRTSSCLVQAGGKGINVARACTILKGDSLTTGILGGLTGQIISNNLRQSNIKNDFYLTEKESRTCLIIADQLKNTHTVINEDGPEFSCEDVEGFFEKFKSLISQSKILVISGSVPQSISVPIYGQLMDVAKKYNVKTILDTSKKALRESIEYAPFMLKVNMYEFSELMNDKDLVQKVLVGDYSLLETYGKKLLDNGIQTIVISLGKKGAWIFNNELKCLVSPPAVKANNPIGSGDAMTAGIVCALSENASIVEAVITGVAAGTANAIVGGISFTYDSFNDIRKQITIKKGDL